MSPHPLLRVSLPWARTCSTCWCADRSTPSTSGMSCRLGRLPQTVWEIKQKFSNIWHSARLNLSREANISCQVLVKKNKIKYWQNSDGATDFIRCSSEQWITVFKGPFLESLLSQKDHISVLSARGSQARQQEKVEARETVSLLSIFDLDAEITQHQLQRWILDVEQQPLFSVGSQTYLN